MIKTITKENFSTDVIRSERPVLIDMWAPWCGYCKMLNPILDRLDGKLDIEIGKINIDDEPELGEKLNAEVIPTLYLYKNGEHGEKLIAPSSQAQLEAWINQQLV